jgi:hypothetical protein
MKSHSCLIRSFDSSSNTLLFSFPGRALFGVAPKIGSQLSEKADLLVQGLLQLRAQLIKLLVIVSCGNPGAQLLNPIL